VVSGTGAIVTRPAEERKGKTAGHPGRVAVTLP
jgi:hypothetical protein